MTTPIYTEADLASRRAEWERVARESSLAGELAKINGRLDLLPATIEVIARKTYGELRTAERLELQVQRAGWRSWAQAIATITQAVIAAGMLYLVLFGTSRPLGH
jgi:hypothetical protein